ncbi:cadherin-related family member 3-like [Nannospalax galili]|uniref:cadherin-related family member 3-like n=1 Tax=Nannospalax galili TaxID=1026970 RepID=UPI000819C95F|nr:cadherin-related family member 3-like [Nannospalax galili]
MRTVHLGMQQAAQSFNRSPFRPELQAASSVVYILILQPMKDSPIQDELLLGKVHFELAPSPVIAFSYQMSCMYLKSALIDDLFYNYKNFTKLLLHWNMVFGSEINRLLVLLSFSLVVKVIDPGGLFATGNLRIFLINVNNKDPTLVCSLFNIENGVLSVASINSTLHKNVNITLDEEIPVGKMVGRCQATDEDNLGDLTFGLDTGNSYFAVDKEKGTVVTTTRLDVGKAGFASSQAFSIKACDGDQRCAAILVTAYIHGINDNSPFCDRYLIRYTGKDVITKGTVVAKLLCHDLDKPRTAIHYVPTSGPVGSGQLFEQVPDAENCIQVSKELDYENAEVVAAGHIYEMMISVFDDLLPSHTVTVTIIVDIAPDNEFSPKFQAAHYSFSVPETSGGHC